LTNLLKIFIIITLFVVFRRLSPSFGFLNQIERTLSSMMEVEWWLWLHYRLTFRPPDPNVSPACKFKNQENYINSKY